MEVSVVDTIADELFTVRIRADHAERLAAHKLIYPSVKMNAAGEVVKHIVEMKHTDFIAYINEIAF